MFGGFVLRHNGNTLKLERNNVTRSMQVLQMLLFHGEEGVPKDVLMDQLFGYEDGVTNPANNLKVTISNLRRILKQVGLEDTTVVFKAGSYHLVSSEEITVDAFQFHQQAELALAAQGEERVALLEAACDLYNGDFLPHLAGCDWAWWRRSIIKRNMRPACTPSAKSCGSGRTGSRCCGFPPRLRA